MDLCQTNENIEINTRSIICLFAHKIYCSIRVCENVFSLNCTNGVLYSKILPQFSKFSKTKKSNTRLKTDK